MACAFTDGTNSRRPSFNRAAPNSRPIEQDSATPPEGQTVGWRVGFARRKTGLARPLVCSPIIFSIPLLDAVVNADCVHCRGGIPLVGRQPPLLLAMAFYCSRPRCDCHRRLTTTPVGKWVSRSQPALVQRHGSTHLHAIDEEHRDDDIADMSVASMAASVPPIYRAAAPLDNNNDPPKLKPNGYLPNGNDHSDSTPNRTNGLKTFQEEDVVYDENGGILGGSLRALIKRLIPRRDYCPERSFIFAFLLNIRTFIAPADLLHQILQHCMFEQNAASENFKKEHRTKFFANILRLCTEWAETFPYDFRTELMQQRLTELLSLCSVDQQNKRKATDLLQQLKTTLNKLERYEKALINLRNEIGEPPHQGEHLAGILLVCDRPLMVAQQLTHIELERLSMIGPEEFVTTLTNDHINIDGDLMKAAQQPKSSSNNIGHYVDWFNHVTYLVGTEVCRHSKKRNRVRIIEYFIDVAKECFNVGNFNSLMAVVAGLSLPAVSRLKKTWARVNMSKLDILQHQLDPSGNFTSYRSTLKAAMWRADGAKNEAERIIIPFFSLLLKDLILVNQRCVRVLPNGHLNFTMFVQFAHHMKDFVGWKNAQCPFDRNSSILQYLLTAPTYTEKHMSLLSFECESPEHSLEKEHYKKLKADLQLSSK
uniref:Uncharacterized protein n=1 Tax=Plectus sambesii TaxID=2011161 RepID=A0A914VWJ8_9BILA